MLALTVVFALILLNGFFAMSEMALMTARKIRLKQMAETSRGARTALALAEHPDNLLSTVQVGITLIAILTGMLGGDAIGLKIANAIGDVHPWVREYAETIGKGTAVACITAASVIFGELIPKRLALTNPEVIASSIALPLDALSKVARPIVATLGTINRGVLRLLGIRDDARDAISEEEIRLMVSESHEQGVIDADERKMMHRVLTFGDRTAEGLMTPRTRIAWLDANASFQENLAVMRATPFSRYPVYRDNDSDVLGVLEAKSLLDSLEHPGVPRMFERMREALFVSESTSALKLLEIFREESQSIALVVDEYGDVAGLVTVNDVMGAVIGRMHSSESDEHSAPIVTREDGSYLVDGALPVDELRELFGSTRLPDEDAHDFHTAAGMVIAHFGRIPNVGEAFEWNDWRIEVVDLDGPRIDKLLLQRMAAAEDDANDPSA